jgi:Ca-activated chloride channel homolog
VQGAVCRAQGAGRNTGGREPGQSRLKPRRRVVWLVAASVALAWLIAPAIAQQNGSGTTAESRSQRDSSNPSIRITSPLGRTGVVTRVRIVAQIHIPPGQTLSAVSFFVDGTLVATTDAASYSSVDWVDENPFERREIVVEANDAAGRTIRDSVVLPPFEVSDKTEVTSILLETGVYDKTGRFVSQLEPSAFTVLENGIQQRIDLVTRETLPTNLLLLVDNSQSMSRTMDFVRLAAERLAGALRQRDQVIVAPFNAHIGAITGPTHDGPTITHAIGSMKAGGGTAFLDGLREATQLLEGLEGRRAVILITDGYDENSTSTVEEVLKSADAAQATIYVVGVGGVAGISLKGEYLLRRIADETGGRIFFPPREPDLVAVANSVATDAHSRYLITYTPANQKRDGSWRQIAVDVPGGLKVRTRAGYFAPSPPPIRPTVEFTVTDAEGFVDVTADDLEVLEDGVEQKIDIFQEAVDPVSIVMALDSSGSMKKSAEAVQQAAREFVGAVRPEDSLATIMFADRPLFAHTLASNHQWALDAIDKYQANGGTALYDALWNSLMHLKGVPGRRAVVVLSDGRDEDNPGTGPGSLHSLDEVMGLVKPVGALIFPIGLGARVDRKLLERLAADSGGEAYFPSDATLIDGQFRRVVENLRRRFVVGYTSTNSSHDGGWRKVDIRARGRSLVVTSRGGYFAPER